MSSDRAEQVREQVLGASKRMHARGLVEETAGNVSARLDGDRVVVTPSSVAYDEMTLDDLVVVDLDGEVVEGHRSPTSEKALHLECFRAYPEVRGVVHCHATHASMFAAARRPIPAGIDEFVMYVGGDVPCAEYHRSSTDGLATEVTAHLADRSAVLMANHGLVCVGRSVDDALRTALVVEHNARVVWGAEVLGGAVPLPDRAVEALRTVYRTARLDVRRGDT